MESILTAENIITAVTLIVTLLLGSVAKKVKFFENNLIPIQNIVIGITVAIIEFAITKDFSVAIAVSGIAAGGAYDIFHNIGKLIEKIKAKKLEKGN